MNHLSSQVRNQPGQHGKILPLQKTQNNQLGFEAAIPAIGEAEGESFEPGSQRLL